MFEVALLPLAAIVSIKAVSSRLVDLSHTLAAASGLGCTWLARHTLSVK